MNNYEKTLVGKTVHSETEIQPFRDLPDRFG
jgi:hypothetical protein